LKNSASEDNVALAEATSKLAEAERKAQTVSETQRLLEETIEATKQQLSQEQQKSGSIQTELNSMLKQKLDADERLIELEARLSDNKASPEADSIVQAELEAKLKAANMKIEQLRQLSQAAADAQQETFEELSKAEKARTQLELKVKQLSEHAAMVESGVGIVSQSVSDNELQATVTALNSQLDDAKEEIARISRTMQYLMDVRTVLLVVVLVLMGMLVSVLAFCRPAAAKIEGQIENERVSSLPECDTPSPAKHSAEKTKRKPKSPATPVQHAGTNKVSNKANDPYSHIYSTPGSPSSFVPLQVAAWQQHVVTATRLAEHYQLPGGVAQVLQLLIKDYADDDDSLPDAKTLKKQAESLLERISSDSTPPQQFDLRLRQSEVKFLKKIPTRALIGSSALESDHSMAIGLLIEQICPSIGLDDVVQSNKFENQAIRDSIFKL